MQLVHEHKNTYVRSCFLLQYLFKMMFNLIHSLKNYGEKTSIYGTGQVN